MLYVDWITAVCTLLEVPLSTNPSSSTPTTDSNFNYIYPRAIEYTELRLQRELDLLATVVTDSTGTTTSNLRNFTYPTDVGTFVVVNQLALIISGVRQPPMTPVSRDFMDYSYPSDTAPTNPSYPIYWCPVNNTSALLGPAPSAAFTVESVGTMRLNPMSASNPSNFLSIQLPDLYLSASMIFLSAYQRDFGATSGDPQQAITWEALYKEQFAGAEVEELRKKFRSIGQSPRSPSPVASQPGN